MGEVVGTFDLSIGMEPTDTKATRGRGRGRGLGRKPTVSHQAPVTPGTEAPEFGTVEEDSEHLEATPAQRTAKKAGVSSSPRQQEDTASLAGYTSLHQQTVKEEEVEPAEDQAHAVGREKVGSGKQQGPSISQRVAAAAAAAAEDTAAQVRMKMNRTMTGNLLQQLWYPNASTLIMALVTLLALLLCFSAVRISRARNSEQDLEVLKAKLENAGQTYMALSRQINDTLSLQMQASARLQLEWQETLVTLKQLAQEWKEAAAVSGVAREAFERKVVEDAEHHAEHVVGRELRRLEADGTEMADFALSTAGGRVVAHSTLFPAQNLPKWFILQQWLATKFPAVFSQPLHPDASQMLLMPRGMPGQCLCLNGSQGSIEVALRTPLLPTAITLEHVPTSITFEPGSAVRDFIVEGQVASKLRLRDSGPFGGQLERQVPEGPFLLGKFSYNPELGPLQMFFLKSQHVVDRIILQVLDNHGARYTCLYRIRVHGHAAQDD